MASNSSSVNLAPTPHVANTQTHQEAPVTTTPTPRESIGTSGPVMDTPAGRSRGNSIRAALGKGKFGKAGSIAMGKVGGKLKSAKDDFKSTSFASRFRTSANNSLVSTSTASTRQTDESSEHTPVASSSQTPADLSDEKKTSLQSQRSDGKSSGSESKESKSSVGKDPIEGFAGPEGRKVSDYQEDRNWRASNPPTDEAGKHRAFIGEMRDQLVDAGYKKYQDLDLSDEKVSAKYAKVLSKRSENKNKAAELPGNRRPSYLQPPVTSFDPVLELRIKKQLGEFAENHKILKEILPEAVFSYLNLHDPSEYHDMIFVQTARMGIDPAAEFTEMKTAYAKTLRGEAGKAKIIEELAPISRILPTAGLMPLYMAPRMKAEDAPKGAILVHCDKEKVPPGTNHGVTQSMQNTPANGSIPALFNTGSPVAGHAGASIGVAVGGGQEAHATAGLIRGMVTSDIAVGDAIVLTTADEAITEKFTKNMVNLSVPSDVSYDVFHARSYKAQTTNLQKMLKKELEKKPEVYNAEKVEELETQITKSEQSFDVHMNNARRGLQAHLPGEDTAEKREKIDNDILRTQSRESAVISYAVPKMGRMYAAKAPPFEASFDQLKNAFAQRNSLRTDFHFDTLDGKPKDGMVCTSIAMLCLQMAYLEKAIEEGKVDPSLSDNQQIIDAIPSAFRVHPDFLAPRAFHDALLKSGLFKTEGVVHKDKPVPVEDLAVLGAG